jgi:hypothetical protein
MYRIQKRKFSSNILEKKYVENDKETWRPFIAPLCNKKEGDIQCLILLKHYNETN